MKYKIVRLASPGEVSPCGAQCDGEKTVCAEYIKETIASGSQEISGKINSSTPLAMNLALDCLMMNNADAFEENKFYTILGAETKDVPTGMVYIKLSGEVKRCPLCAYFAQMSGRKSVILPKRR